MILLLACVDVTPPGDTDVPDDPTVRVPCVPSEAASFPIEERATWILDGAEGVDRALGARSAVGDLDDDGLDDLVIASAKGAPEPNVYVVLGSDLTARPAGRYPIADVASVVLTVPQGSGGSSGGAYWTYFEATPHIVPGALYLHTDLPREPLSRIAWADLASLPHGPTALDDVARSAITSPSGGLSTCDLDGDGVLDLVVGGDGDPAGFLALGPSTEPTAFIGAIAGGIDQIRCLDVDGDPYADLVLVTRDPDTNARVVGIHRGASSRGTADVRPWAPDVRVALDGDTSHLGVPEEGAGDWDADGHPDLLVTLSKVARTEVLLFRGEAGFRADGTELGREDRYLSYTDPEDGRLGTGASLARDENGDGYAELVLGRPNAADAGAVLATSCPGPGGDRDVMQIRDVELVGEEAGFGGVILQSGDLDGDGRADLVAGTSDVFPLPGAVYVVR